MGADVDILRSTERVIALGLATVVPNALHCAQIEDAVRRIHRITIDATELVALHIARCVEEDLDLPVVSATFYKMAMMLVTVGKGALRSVDHELRTTRNSMDAVRPVSRVGLDQLMMAQSITLASNFDVNLCTHFRKRVARYVRLLRSDSSPENADDRKQWKLDTMMIASDVCKGGRDVIFASRPEFHDMVRTLRERLETSAFASTSMESNVRSHQSALIRATHRMNAAFEAAEKRCLSVCPLRRNLTPAFVQIDTQGIRQILGMPATDYEKNRARTSAKRRANRTARDARNLRLRAEAAFPVQRRVRQPIVGLDVDSDAVRIAVTRLQRAWRRVAHRHVCALARAHLRQLTMLQSAVRRWVRRTTRARRHASETRAAGLQKSKDDIWNDVLRLDRAVVKRRRADVFAGSLRTDGVSVRLLFRSTAGGGAGVKRKRTRTENVAPVGAPEDPIPTRGLYAIDQLKHLTRLQSAQIIGADPGKRELLVCVDADAPTGARRQPSVRYTAAQRRHEMRSARHASEMARTTPHALKASMNAMTDTNSRSSSLQELTRYFRRRREWLYDGLEHFETSRYRRRRWQRFIGEQESVSKFVARIRSLRRDADTPMVLGYGSWGGIAGRAGAACNRHHPPCIGVGLRRRLSRHFCVVSTPEHMTSKTCSLCGGRCGPCAEVDAFHRERKLSDARASDDPSDVRRAERFSVRGLRRCHNVACAAYLNRDHNAARNIQMRCKALLTGGTLVAMDDIDERLDVLHAEIMCGD